MRKLRRSNIWSSSETQGQIVGTRKNLNGRKNIWHVLYFSSCHIFFRPLRLFLVRTICPWVSEDDIWLQVPCWSGRRNQWRNWHKLNRAVTMCDHLIFCAIKAKVKLNYMYTESLLLSPVVCSSISHSSKEVYQMNTLRSGSDLFAGWQMKGGE